MTLYKIEKKRIGSGRWGIVCGVLFYYLILLQGQMLPINELKKYKGIEAPIEYRTGALVFGMLVLGFYLCDKLFYVKERGKKVKIMKKYEIVPIHAKAFYRVKMRIAVETMLALIVGSVLIYFFVLVANQHFFIDPGLLKNVAIVSGFALIFTAIMNWGRG